MTIVHATFTDPGDEATIPHRIELVEHPKSLERYAVRLMIRGAESPATEDRYCTFLAAVEAFIIQLRVYGQKVDAQPRLPI